MPMKITTVRLTERLWSLIEAQAQEEGASAAQLIREGAMMRLGYALGKRGREEAPAERSPGSETAAPFPDFASASAEVLEFLHERLGFALWLVTRVEGDQYVIEQSRDEGYGIEVGDAFSFDATYCARMLEGEGPRFAHEIGSVPSYAAAPMGEEYPVAAYIGVPLVHADGSLFGTLCAIDPAPQPPPRGDELPLIELSGRLLSSLLDRDAQEREN